MHFPLPETDLPLNYDHSAGLRYEGEEVRRCLLKGTLYKIHISVHLFLGKFNNKSNYCVIVSSLIGLKESPEMPWAHSILLMETLDEARRQMGVIYDQDKL